MAAESGCPAAAAQTPRSPILCGSDPSDGLGGAPGAGGLAGCTSAEIAALGMGPMTSDHTVSLCGSEDISDACMGMDFMQDDALSRMPEMRTD